MGSHKEHTMNVLILTYHYISLLCVFYKKRPDDGLVQNMQPMQLIAKISCVWLILYYYSSRLLLCVGHSIVEFKQAHTKDFCLLSETSVSNMLHQTHDATLKAYDLSLHLVFKAPITVSITQKFYSKTLIKCIISFRFRDCENQTP